MSLGFTCNKDLITNQRDYVGVRVFDRGTNEEKLDDLIVRVRTAESIGDVD